MSSDSKHSISKLFIHNLCVSYDKKIVLDSINHTVLAGDILYLNQKNGSGKTTLLNTISGDRTADSGEIMVDGKMILDLPIQKRPVAYLRQDLPHFSNLTVRQTFELSKTKWTDVVPILKDFALEKAENILMSELSGGQRQLVLLIQMVHLNREVLLLDEPYAKLDAANKAKAHEYVKNVVRTHNRYCLLAHHGDLS